MTTKRIDELTPRELENILHANTGIDELCDVLNERLHPISPDEVVVGREILSLALSALRCCEPYKACGFDHTQKRLDAINALKKVMRISAQAITPADSASQTRSDHHV